MRVVSWNVARRSSRLAEQAAALARRDPDVVALQEVTKRTLPLWRAALETIGISSRAGVVGPSRSGARAGRPAQDGGDTGRAQAAGGRPGPARALAGDSHLGRLFIRGDRHG